MFEETITQDDDDYLIFDKNDFLISEWYKDGLPYFIGKGVKLKYIHQLQNLYHALTLGELN